MKYEYGCENSLDGKTWTPANYVPSTNKRRAKEHLKTLVVINGNAGCKFRLVRRRVEEWEACK